MRRINLKTVNAARPATVRNINRQIILNIVREKEPISRAEIAKEIALHRSTISVILDKLIGDGLIEEVRTGESTGGRPPTLLRIRAAGAVAIGVDIGHSRTTVATSNLAGRVLEQEAFDTEPSAEKTLGSIISRVRRMVKNNGGEIEGVGISVPGIVNAEYGEALYVPRFGWGGLAISRKVYSATKLPVIVDNDANAVALAELWFGRPEVSGVRRFILVSVGDGIGTGVVIDGQVYRGEQGAAGEFGHMTIGQGAPVSCAAGSFSCWESFASERAALSRYQKLACPENDCADLTFNGLIDRALTSEPAALAALKETARYVGIGISNIIKGLSPEAVIVGGAIVRAWPIVVQEINRVIEENHCHLLPRVRMIPSTLGEQSGLMGALSLVLAGKFAHALSD